MWPGRQNYRTRPPKRPFLAQKVRDKSVQQKDALWQCGQSMTNSPLHHCGGDADVKIEKEDMHAS